MKKVVVKLTFHDDKSKQNPMQAVSSIEGISAMSMEGDKITVIGDVDPVQVVKKLRKWFPQLDTVGPAKEEKKEAGGGDKKKEEEKKKSEAEEQIAKLIAASYNGNYNPNYYYTQPTYPVHTYPIHTPEENPDSCVIC